MTEIEIIEETISDTDVSIFLNSQLVVWNDDHNSFQHVIDCFCKYLKQDTVQAEQCALLIHTKGKCSVKEGMLEELKPIRDALIENGLSCTIE